MHESALPRGFWGTPPKSPTQPQAPLHAPGAFHDVALAESMTLNFINNLNNSQVSIIFAINIAIA